MYRILIILSSIVLLAACQKESRVDSPATLTYTVVPKISFDLKSGAEPAEVTTSEVNSLSYMVYHKKADGRYVYVREMGDFVTITDASDIKVPITLIKDQEYILVFIAQHRFQNMQRTDSYAYNYDTDNGIMSVNTNAGFTSGDQLEAFVKVDRIGPVKGNESRMITLDRIVSQINVGTSSTTLPAELDIKVEGTPATYDIFNGKYSTQTISLSFSKLAVPAEKINVQGTDYNRLTTLYCLGSNKLGLTLTNTADQTDKFSISNVTTQVNYKTNIAGNILPDEIDYNNYKVSTFDALKEALANEKVEGIQLTQSFEITEPIRIRRNISIDGKGTTLRQASNWNFNDGPITFDNCTATIKDIIFDGTHTLPAIRTINSDFTAEGITVKNHSNGSYNAGILRLHGKSHLNGCKFLDNTCTMAVSLNMTEDNGVTNTYTDPQIIENCEFLRNTCTGKAVLYYHTGNGITLNANKFCSNTITTNEKDVATVYMGYNSGCTITNNTIQNNTVTTTSGATAKKISGGLMIGYPATITGNTITGNTPNDVYIDVIYGSIDLTNNTITEIVTTNNNY